MADQGLNIAVIGAGAAGVFAAIHAAQGNSQVQIFEASNKALAKVKISGGGRCNVCHDVQNNGALLKAFPRSSKAMRKAFGQFAYPETRAWFESRGLALKVESDGRVFPSSDDSQSVIDILLGELKAADIPIHFSKRLKAVVAKGAQFELDFGSVKESFDRVILAMGGQAQIRGFGPLDPLGLDIVSPLPSLFTFNVPDSDLKDLQGLSVPMAKVQIPGTKWQQDGPLLITHWGFSGPAVLKLSAWQARDLAERNYKFPILINWLNWTDTDYEAFVGEQLKLFAKKKLANARISELPRRLWERLVLRAQVSLDKRWVDLSKKELNRIREQILRAEFKVSGKTTFKEEFVTAGGIALSELDFKDYSLKKFPGLYAVGELIDVDGITGGFNFQHAWTSGFLAGRASAQ